MNLNTPRMMGKSRVIEGLAAAEASMGKHVHLIRIDGIGCFNGPDDCAAKTDEVQP